VLKEPHADRPRVQRKGLQGLCYSSGIIAAAEGWSLLRVSRVFQWVRTAVEPGDISLRHYLIFAFLVRLPAAFFSRGYGFSDHQFQYVDPAYYLAFDGSWWRPHDYVQGLRSWVYPGILAGVFKLIAWIGITEPHAMMVATRFVHGLISLVPVAALWTLIVRFKGWSGQRPLLLFFAANALVVYSGVQPTGPTFAVGLSLTAVFLFHGPGRPWPFFSGLLLGLAFACRFQDAFFGPLLLGAGLLQKRWRACLFLALGSAITVTGQGLVDLFTWGKFLHSPLRYVAWNVFEGQARRYGDQPVWLYAAFICLVLVFVPPFLRSGLRALREGSGKLPVMAAASLFYILLHNVMARKDFRFVVPALILLLVVYASSLLFPESSESKLRRIHRRLFVGMHLVTLALASIWYPNRGPIEAALTLNRLDDFRDRLVIVDAGDDALGGYYYLRRPRMEVDSVKREHLDSWLRAARPTTPIYLLVVRHPLAEGVDWGRYRLELVGEYRDWPDTREDPRRFLYRATRRADRSR